MPLHERLRKFRLGRKVPKEKDNHVEELSASKTGDDLIERTTERSVNIVNEGPSIGIVNEIPEAQDSAPMEPEDQTKGESEIVVPPSRPGSGPLKYDTLPKERSFRLLTLRRSSYEHSSYSSLPEVTIQTYDLDTAPPFKALSYTWDLAFRVGRKRDEETQVDFPEIIICNGVVLKVTQNLFDALSTFLATNLFELIWIDAICINQDDLQERAAQVSIMGNIYSAAEEVIVWLGPLLPHFRGAVEAFVWATTDLLTMIEKAKTDATPKRIFGPENFMDPQFWDDRGLEDQVSQLGALALFIRSCRWFSRAWILQEVSLAKNARMFCGSVEVSFSKAAKLALVLYELDWGRQIAEFAYMADKSFARDMVVDNWLTELGTFHFTLQMTTQLFESRFKQDWKEDAGPFWMLSTLLTNCRASGAKDPRDKVFAILGIVEKHFPNPPITTMIKPGYETSAEELFVLVTKLILENSATLHYIADTRKESSVTDLDIPTWTVNYTSPDMAISFVHDGSFNASRRKDSKRLSPSFFIQDWKLHCSGALFDTVEEIQPTSLQRAFRQPSALLQLYQFYVSLPRRIQGLRRLEVYWRTLTIDLLPQNDDSASEDSDVEHTVIDQSLELGAVAQMTTELVILLQNCSGHEVAELAGVILELSSPDSPEEQKLITESVQILIGDKHGNKEDEGEKSISLYKASTKYRRRFTQVIGRRKLFRTSRGLLGLGVETVQKGDQVWLLQDSDVPFILRGTEDPSCFGVVGDCYIRGFMYGEMLDEEYGVKEKIAQIVII